MRLIGSLFGLFFDLENGGSTFPRNIGADSRRRRILSQKMVQPERVTDVCLLMSIILSSSSDLQGLLLGKRLSSQFAVRDVLQPPRHRSTWRGSKSVNNA
jgi:hypothetical protein